MPLKYKGVQSENHSYKSKGHDTKDEVSTRNAAPKA